MPLQAATLTATPATIEAIFAVALPGDTIKAVGNFGEVTLADRQFVVPVTIDATNAVFSNTLTLKNISHVLFVNGTFGSVTTATRLGRAVALYSSNTVVFSKSKFIGAGAGVGLGMTGSTNVAVSAASFTNLRLGIGVTASSDVRLSSNRFTNMPGDGINIAGSHRVIATTNTCSGGNPAPGAHPDCIQLWSLVDTPVQSDIVLTKNVVNGATQGLTSFTPANGGGLRISIIDNIIATSYPQGIACYGCVDSIITRNTLTTLPGSQWRTSINVVGGSNNYVEGNSVGAKRESMTALSSFDASEDDPSTSYDDSLPDFVTEDLAYFADNGIDNAYLSLMWGNVAAFNAIPEPAIWVEIIFGFALVGIAVRRRASRVVLAA